MNKDLHDRIKNTKLTPEQQALFNQVKKKAGTMKGKSESEMLSQIEQIARTQKQAGKLDNKALDEFAARIAPALNDKQKIKMKQILVRLKKQ